MAERDLLTIRLFGAFEAALNGVPLARAWHNDRLLALLVLRRSTPTERAWLAAALWPEADEANARFYLRRTLAALRQALGTQVGRLLSPTLRTLQLDLSGADCDLAAFDTALARGDRAALEAAVVLYRGPLLEGWHEEWALLDRGARERNYLDALETLARDALARLAPEETARHLRSLLALEPLRESAQRALMQALAAMGDYAAVTQTYRDFRLLMHQALRAEPAAETTALYRLLRAEAREQAQPPHTLAPSAPPLCRLPSPPTPFLGREAEREQVLALLETTRLLTLTGTGGVGKTRLALAVAEEIAEEYQNGVCFVDLAPLQDPTRVVLAVAVAVEAREEPNRPLIETLTYYLQPRSLLLILDNCEHLVEACASLAQTLLDRCPRLHLLATSRQPLGAAGERTWRVPSLTLPEGSEREWETEKGAQTVLMGSEAAQLFVERATSASPAFRLTRENLVSVAEICRLLDGIPLALELAAAWGRMMPVSQTLSRLRERLDLLQSQYPGRLARHQTLRATLDWSYELLEAEEQRLLGRLSGFAGGWTLEAAEAVCGEGGDGADAVLMRLAGLVDRSLAVYEEQGGVGRYRLLETTRQYARDRLMESGERETIRERHRNFYLALAEGAAPKLEGAEQPVWLKRLDKEHENLRAGLEWSLLEAAPTGGLRLCGALQRFWWTRGYLSEGLEWSVRALGKAGDQGRTAERAKALNGAGVLSRMKGDYASAQAYYEASLDICREIRDRDGIAFSLNGLGLVAFNQGAYASVQAYYEESLDIKREIGNRDGITTSLNNLGIMASHQGDYASAQAYHEESLSIRREIGGWSGIATSLYNLGYVASAQGNYTSARVYFEEGLSIQREIRDRSGIAYSLESFASLAVKESRADQAALLWGAAEALREEIGSPLPPNQRELCDRAVNEARQALGEEAFARAWAEGRAMTLEQAVEYALQELTDL